MLLGGSAGGLGPSGASGTSTPVLGASTRAHDATSAATLALTVYHPAVASYYGGPLLGRRTACGVMLRRTTLGVANLTVKCGTDVRIFYRGRMIVVPVIDRGPYVKGRSWDLTQATAKALGMLSVGVATIGTVALPSGSSVAAPTTAGSSPTSASGIAAGTTTTQTTASATAPASGSSTTSGSVPVG